MERVLRQNPTTMQWKVWGDVRDQVITLNGRVQNWRERNYIEELCKGIKGVRSIQNQVEVASHDELSDAGLEEQIESLLAWDTRIDASQLEVIVNQQKAVLVGSLPNAHQKRIAIEQSHITGITSVDAGNLNGTLI